MTYIKIVKSGSITEIYEYDKLNTTYNPPDEIRQIEKGTGILNLENYKRQMKIRNDTVRRLTTLNFNDKCLFITLTTELPLYDLKIANREFKKFIQRLKWAYPELEIKYIAVVEFQDKNRNGAIHYHMITNLVISNDKLSKLWGLGFVNIKGIKSIDNLGAYLVKYMVKTTIDERLQGLKAYNYSKNLNRPIELKSWGGDGIKIYDEIKELKDQKKEPIYSRKYISQNTGNIVYLQYNDNRKPK